MLICNRERKLLRSRFPLRMERLSVFPITGANGWCFISIRRINRAGCTIQAHEYQSNLPKFEEHHAVVLGVSLDTAESHKSFCTQDGLTFKLLADPDRQAATAYGVPLMTFKDMKFDERDTFLISPKGTIAEVWSSKVGSAKVTARIVLGAIAKQGKIVSGLVVCWSGSAPTIPFLRSTHRR